MNQYSRTGYTIYCRAMIVLNIIKILSVKQDFGTRIIANENNIIHFLLYT